MSTSTTSAWLTTRQLSQELGIPEGTLRQWRVTNRGPRSVALEGVVRYRRSDIEAWIADHDTAA